MVSKYEGVSSEIEIAHAERVAALEKIIEQQKKEIVRLKAKLTSVWGDS